MAEWVEKGSIKGPPGEYENATASSDGLMSSEDKTKLDGMIEMTDGEITEIFSAANSADN